MFNVSKETYANCSDAINHTAPHGRYTRLHEEQVHADHARCYVSPELSQVEKIKITGFPSDGKHNIVPGTTVDFLIIKNGAPGNIAVHVIPPNGLVTSQQRSHIDVIELSPDSYVAHVPVTEIGTYTVHVRFNDVELPRSPLTFRSGSCL